MEMHKTLISNYSTKANLNADILVSTVTCLEALIRKKNIPVAAHISC